MIGEWKRFMRGIFVLAILLCAWSAFAPMKAMADEEEPGRFFSHMNEEGGLTITGYGGTDEGELGIPEQLEYYNDEGELMGELPVTQIAEQAFQGMESLRSIYIPGRVTTIGYEAFQGCSNLQEISIPDSVRSIGIRAFADCSNLKNVFLPSQLSTIGEQTFANCISLEYMTVNDGVTEIYNEAFINCRKLKTVYLPEGMKSIGEQAFFNCSDLENINFPTGMTTIRKEAFGGCSSLSRIELHGNITHISVRAFAYCSSLTDLIFDHRSDDPTDGSMKDIMIEEEAFAGCSSLENIILPEHLNGISKGMFRNNTSLRRILIPAGVGEIQDEAFWGCSILSEVTLPENSGVWFIGSNAFEGCGDLTIGAPFNSYAYGYALANHIKVKRTDHDIIAPPSRGCEIAFHPMKGKVEQTSKVVILGEAYGSLPVPVRRGYLFEGWYTQERGGTRILTSTTVATDRNHTLYARWNAAKSKVTFDANKGSSSMGSMTVTYGTSYGKLPTAKRGGYVLYGWFTKPKGGKEVKPDTEVSEEKDQTLYAQWGKVTVNKVLSIKLKNIKPKKMSVTMKPVKGAKGYEIVYGTNPSIKKNKKSVSTSSAKTNISKLKKGTTYYVKARAYKVDSMSKKIYGAYSNVKKIKIKK